MLDWNIWNRIVLTFKLRIYTKLNCLKWNNCQWSGRPGFNPRSRHTKRFLKWYLIPPCLTLGKISYVSRVMWSNPGKGEPPSPTPRCSSYWKGNILVAPDYSRQLYFICIKKDLALNNLQQLMCHKTKSNQTKHLLYQRDQISIRSISFHAFVRCMLTSLLVDEMMLPKYVDWSTNFRGL